MSSMDYSNLRVLIVDDFHNFRTALAKNIYNLGFRHIFSVCSGSEALGSCRKHHFDIILSDYNLGAGKNGQQLLEELRHEGLMRDSDIFMLISADTSRDVVMASYDCEPSDYLTKPITGKTLEQRIRRLLAKREEMLPVYNAMDDGAFDEAITRLQHQLKSPSRYSIECQKMLGELYLQQRRYDEAASLYNSVLAVRDLDWARVGLANLELEQGKHAEAISLLENVVDESPSYLKAYDSLTKACEIVGDRDKLQEVLEKAAAISPMSIGRQKDLADTALANGDVELAIKAYKKTIKYGANSYYDTVDNHLNFARAIAKVYDNDVEKGNDVSLNAIHLLNAIDNKFDVSEEQKIQAKLLNSQINALNGNKKASDDLFHQARELIEVSDVRNIITEVESVNALIITGEYQEARKVLSEMLEYYAHDQAALEKIDPLLDEPVSEAGKQIIGRINKKGINFYKNHDYENAVIYFNKAQKKYPRYIGLKLNMAQAMISEIRENGFHEGYVEQCISLFTVVERYITPESEKFQRYKQLKLMYQQAVSHARMIEKTKGN